MGSPAGYDSYPQQKTRDSLSYSIIQEKYMKVFLEDGNIPIDNSATERATRPLTIDTIHGTEASAVVYSLAETAKANNLKI